MADNREKTLQDTLHRCIMCNEPAHECEKDTYRCSKESCGCVWKVERCGR